MATNNNKLRTANDIINRLKWEETEDEEGEGIVMIGYDDRIKGPMEKCLKDYVPIEQGGDIPQHRIQYFRLAAAAAATIDDVSIGGASTNRQVIVDEGTILWDRVGRVDRVFNNSGNRHGEVSSQTVDQARRAVQNMKRLAEEREARAAEKAKRKARKRAQLAKRVAASTSGIPATHASKQCTADVKMVTERYTWESLGYYSSYSEQSSTWTTNNIILGGIKNVKRPSNNTDEKDQDGSAREMKVVTWNVLNDLRLISEGCNNGEWVHDSLLDKNDSTFGRYQVLLDELSSTDADLIALQEVNSVFVHQLECQSWVQSGYDYASTSTTAAASPDQYKAEQQLHQQQGFETNGLLSLWKRDKLSPHGVHLSRDGKRKRSLIVTLLDGSGSSISAANIHLPADPPTSSGGRGRREVARMRELGVVIGKLQLLEQQSLRTNQKKVSTLILGDTNIREGQDPELFDDDNYFVDCWKEAALLSGNNNDEDDNMNCGWTFDPITNPRAEKTRSLCQSSNAANPRRIDRIYHAQQQQAWQPIKGKILGKRNNISGGLLLPYPPSDHYGVEITLRCSCPSARTENTTTSTTTGCLYSSIGTTQPGRTNAWARHAVPSSDSLLALLLDNEDIIDDGEDNDRGHEEEPFELYSPSSSLPIPHITLLLGFCDLFSEELRSLAQQAVQDCIQQALYCGDDNNNQTQQSDDDYLSLPFNPDSSLSVFEHSNSATLVAIPDMNEWLHRLYDALRTCFRRCDEQECRSLQGDRGWQPHLSLGSYTTTNAARMRINHLLSSGIWKKKSRNIQVRGIGIFRRNVEDGKFYAVASIPLLRNESATPFLVDAGTQAFAFQQSASYLVLREAERACQHVLSAMAAINNYPAGQQQQQWQAKLIPVGSYALHASIPYISDIDAVVRIICPSSSSSCSSRSFCTGRYLDLVMQRLQSLHYPQMKARRRSAACGTVGSNNIANRDSRLEVLTLRLWPGSPSVDLTVFIDGKNSNISDKAVHDSLVESQVIENKILIAVESSGYHGMNFIPIFHGALRLIKLWAFKRCIYGCSTGFIGGGGWAVWLAKVIIDGLPSAGGNDSSSPPPEEEAPLLGLLSRLNSGADGRIHASYRLVAYFWKTVSRAWHTITTVSLTETAAAGNEAQRRHGRISILAAAGGGEGNYWRSSTRSTTQATKEEFDRALSLLHQANNIGGVLSPSVESLKAILCPLQVEEVLMTTNDDDRPPEVCVLKVSSSLLPPAELKAWGSSRFLSLLVELERWLWEKDHRTAWTGNDVSIRPLSKPIKGRNINSDPLSSSPPSAPTTFLFPVFVRKSSRSTEEGQGGCDALNNLLTEFARKSSLGFFQQQDGDCCHGLTSSSSPVATKFEAQLHLLTYQEFVGLLSER